MMYLESIFNLCGLEEIAPELVRQGLLNILSDLYQTNPDIEISRMCAKILDKFVNFLFFYFLVQK
jgi:hypothetical protein